MAPERTAKTLESAALPRNSACLQCRSRKVKCDGLKPICARCHKGAIARGEDPAFACTYDVVAEKKVPRRSAAGQGASTKRVTDLETKIADLEKLLKENNGSQASGSSSDPNSPQDEYLIPQFAAISSLSQPSTNLSMPSFSYDYSNMAPISSEPFVNPLLSSAPAMDDRFMLDLLYPGYDPDLPSPDIVNQVLHVYFGRPHIATYMIDQGDFMARLALPPKHQNYPLPALIHAMMAVAYSISAKTLSLYWQNDPTAKSPADYHINKAKALIERSLENCKRLIDLTQACSLHAFALYVAGRFGELWMACGNAIRMTPPTGLNHVENSYSDEYGNITAEASTSIFPDKQKFFKKQMKSAIMIASPQNEKERYSRAITFWVAFMADRMCSASTNFANAMDEEEISTLLPNGLQNTGPLEPPQKYAESLSIWSDTFFVSHPPGVVGPLQLYLKSVILLGRCTTFVNRAPYPVGRSQRHHARRNKEAETPLSIYNSAEFRQRDADCISFRLSFHRDYKAILNNNGHFEGNAASHFVLLANNIAHVATILLHEPFCTSANEDESMSRSLTSARQILSTIYMLLSSTYDIGLFNPFAIFTWQVAAKVLIRELAIKQAQQDFAAQNTIQQELRVIQGAMAGMKNSLADHNIMGLSFMLSNPGLLMPPPMLSGDEYCNTANIGPCPSLTEAANSDDLLRRASSSASTLSSHSVPTPPSSNLFTPSPPLFSTNTPPALFSAMDLDKTSGPIADFSLLPDLNFLQGNNTFSWAEL